MIHRESWYREALGLEKDLQFRVKSYQPGNVEDLRDIIRIVNRTGRTLPWELIKKMSGEDFWRVFARQNFPEVHEERETLWVGQGGVVLHRDQSDRDVPLDVAMRDTFNRLSPQTKWIFTGPGTIEHMKMINDPYDTTLFLAVDPDSDSYWGPEGIDPLYYNELTTDAQALLEEHGPILFSITYTYSSPELSPKEFGDLVEKFIPFNFPRGT